MEKLEYKLAQRYLYQDKLWSLQRRKSPQPQTPGTVG